MAFALTWLAEVLEDAGLKVAEQPGWRTRGRGDVGTIKGVICHHTAGPPHGIMPSLGIVTNGRPDLAGPLAQLCLGRDGTFFVVAAGRANHAGGGSWQSITTGNSSFIGIEAENTGLTNDPWPAVQIDAYSRGVAAILKKIGANPIMCCGHKEYALPKGRKTDPTFDMSDFRQQLGALVAGTAPPPAVILRVVDTQGPTYAAPRRARGLGKADPEQAGGRRRRCFRTCHRSRAERIPARQWSGSGWHRWSANLGRAADYLGSKRE